ncbi:tyrosine-type recombinase/integrase [Tardiphaga sp. vice278]|uniref:tyrosine-type recombinase/integrase n=1 Tax=Tardiphaga sp. vice278 TaxID=2592815 RepID=UPI0011636208|nr:site-specific integrase [Tardiphaga sp. vice278]QDM19235.1 site-specific integrase [Tardiphaga sp. vice278]
MPRRNSGARLRFLEKRQCFYIVWTDGGRSRERSTGTADRKLAESALADFLHLRTRDAGPRDPAEIFVTDVLADYAEERGPETASPWRIAAAVKAMVPFWQGKTVAQITRESCRSYVTARARSAGTSRRELGVLRAAINHAHRCGRLTRIVAVDLPDSPEPNDRWLTRKEAAALLRAALREPRVRLHLPLFILLGLYSGQRKSAILSLRWSQVDLDAGRMDFNNPGAQRSNKRRARQPIPRRLLAHLRRARLRGSDLGCVVHENGQRLKDIKRGFESACVRAGLEDVTPHVLRHTCATWLMQRGVPLWEASGYLKMTQETLQRVYGHHHPDFLKGAAEAFS